MILIPKIGPKLKDLRIRCNLTQVQLAKKIGVSPSTIGMYEQNRREPNFEILGKLCKVLSIQASCLLETKKIKKSIEIDEIPQYIEMTLKKYIIKKNGSELSCHYQCLLIYQIIKAIQNVTEQHNKNTTIQST